MSYEAWGEPDDGPELPDGWLHEEAVEQLQALLKHFEYPDPFPRPDNRNDAILIMLDHILNPPKYLGMVPPPEDPNVTWAKLMLRDVV